MHYYDTPFKFHTLIEMYLTASQKNADKIAVYYHNKNDCIESKTFRSFLYDVLRAVTFFKKCDIQNKYILMENQYCYHWLVYFFAAICTTNTIYLIDSQIQDDQFQDVANSVNIDLIISDHNGIERWQTVLGAKQNPQVHFMNISTAPWDKYFPFDGQLYCDPEHEAVVMFTSGSTGKMKGVILTHKNLSSDIQACQMLLGKSSSDVMLSFLPVHHAFGLTTGVLVPLYVGASVCIPRDKKKALFDIKNYKPTIMIIVPVIAKTFAERVANELKRKNLKFLIPFITKREKLPLALRKLLYCMITPSFGGKLDTLVCGGASLSELHERALSNMGFTILCGYGATECSPVISCNMKGREKRGSVGIPTPFCAVKIVNGELWVSGDIVSKGYLGGSESHSTIEDGWFKTGDLGYIDNDNYIYITDRANDLLVLDNGENISPARIETALEKISSINEVVVILKKTESRKLLTAVVFPKNCCDNEELLKKEIYDCIHASKNPASMKIEKIIIVNDPFPKLSIGKINREEVIRKHGGQ